MELKRIRFTTLYLTISFVLKFLFFLYVYFTTSHIPIEKTLLVKDSINYYNFASHIQANLSLNYHGIYFISVGYPLFLFLIFITIGKNLWFLLFLQLIIHVFSGLLCYKIAKRVFNETIARLAAILFMLDLHVFLISFKLLTETVFIFLFLLSTLYLLKALDSKKLKHWFVACLFLTIATFTRSVLFYYPIGIILIVLVFYRASVLYKLKVTLIYGGIFFLCISSILLNNYYKYGYFQLSYLQGSNLLFYHATYTQVYKTKQPLTTIRDQLQKEALSGVTYDVNNPFEESTLYQKHAVKYIKANPWAYAKVYLDGIFFMYFQPSTHYLFDVIQSPHEQVEEELFLKTGAFDKITLFFKIKSHKEVYIGLLFFLVLGIQYLGLFAGLVYLVIHRKFQLPVLIVLATIFYLTAIIGPMGISRFKLPIIPFYLMITAYGYYHLFKKQFKPKATQKVRA